MNKNKKTRIKALRTKYAKAKKENLKEIEDEILDIQQNLPAVPVYPRVWAQDVTPEHLGTLLSKHNERMVILSAEGGIFDIMAGQAAGSQTALLKNVHPDMDVSTWPKADIEIEALDELLNHIS